MKKIIILFLIMLPLFQFESIASETYLELGRTQIEIRQEYKTYEIIKNGKNLIIKYPNQSDVDYILYIFKEKKCVIKATYFKNGTTLFINKN